MYPPIRFSNENLWFLKNNPPTKLSKILIELKFITVALLVSRVYPTFRATRPTTGQPVYPTAESSLLSPLHFSPSIQSKCTLPRNTNGSMNPSSFSWASNTVTVIFVQKLGFYNFMLAAQKKFWFMYKFAYVVI